VCHFGHFLLFSLLLDRLRAAAPARVVVVASESHRYPRTLEFERFPLEAARYRGLVAYGQAKLCNVLFANELTRRHAAEGVLANSLHPGSLIGTSIFRSSVAAKLLGAAARPFTKSIAQGAATTVYCATAPELNGIGGRYFADCTEKRASSGARDEQAARRLWELTSARISAS
jgi:WW domain-containing oxidoreductase